MGKAAVVALLALVGAALGVRSAPAEAGLQQARSFVVSIGSLRLVPGDRGSVDLSLTDATDPVGAWVVEITYDPHVASIVGCAPRENSGCNTAYRPQTVRVTGASALGLLKDTVLATLDLKCLGEGHSELSLSVSQLGIPEAFFDVQVHNGDVTCAEPALSTPTREPSPTPAAAITLPTAGAGPPSTGRGFIALGAALLLMLATFVGAFTLHSALSHRIR